MRDSHTKSQRRAVGVVIVNSFYGSEKTRPSDPHRQLETTFEGDCHRAQLVARVIDEYEVLIVHLGACNGVVADHDRTLAETR